MRKIQELSRLFSVAVLLSLAAVPAAAEGPLVERFLLDGQLSEGAKALELRLKGAPQDDQARFGLGVLQFLQTFEHLGGGLYKYGLRTEEFFLRTPPAMKEFLPQNPHPETLTYAAGRQLIQTFVDDIAKVEATLAEVKDSAVQLPLHVGLIRIDPFGQGKPISAAFLIQRTRPPEAIRRMEALVVGFDRGDVSWLRGYCHILSALGELSLAVDGQRAFDCCAHLLFEKVETPHTFLLEKRRPFDDALFSLQPLLFDVISLFHQMMRLSIQEPARSKAALEHLEAAIVQAKELWKFILAETDDDNEWIPGPKQTGVVGVKVTQEIVDAWLETLDEAELVLKGKRLIPFWRGNRSDLGVNLRRVFLESREFDIVEWVQGTAATPYLENGPLTKFADPAVVRRLTNAFGGPWNFIGFGFWFN